MNDHKVSSKRTKAKLQNSSNQFSQKILDIATTRGHYVDIFLKYDVSSISLFEENCELKCFSD